MISGQNFSFPAKTDSCLPGFEDLSPKGGIRSNVCHGVHNQLEDTPMESLNGVWIGVAVLVGVAVGTVIAAVVVVIRKRNQSKYKLY